MKFNHQNKNFPIVYKKLEHWLEVKLGEDSKVKLLKIFIKEK